MLHAREGTDGSAVAMHVRTGLKLNNNNPFATTSPLFDTQPPFDDDPASPRLPLPPFASQPPNHRALKPAALQAITRYVANPRELGASAANGQAGAEMHHTARKLVAMQLAVPSGAAAALGPLGATPPLPLLASYSTSTASRGSSNDVSALSTPAPSIVTMPAPAAVASHTVPLSASSSSSTTASVPAPASVSSSVSATAALGPVSDIASDGLSLARPSIAALAALRSQVFGHDASYTTPFGKRAMVYADYAASGRLLEPMEAWLTRDVYPWFANVHSDVGECARITGKYVTDARAVVADFCRAPLNDYAVVFVGAGVTGAVAKLAHMLAIHPRIATGRRKFESTDALAPPTGERPVVIVSLMEHHSNVVFWREMDCDLLVRSSHPLCSVQHALRCHPRKRCAAEHCSAARPTRVLTPQTQCLSFKPSGLLCRWRLRAATVWWTLLCLTAFLPRCHPAHSSSAPSQLAPTSPASRPTRARSRASCTRTARSPRSTTRPPRRAAACRWLQEWWTRRRTMTSRCYRRTSLPAGLDRAACWSSGATLSARRSRTSLVRPQRGYPLFASQLGCLQR